MFTIHHIILSSVITTLSWPLLSTAAAMHDSCRDLDVFPPSYELFSSTFQQPAPPLVKDEFKTHWKQHAWSPHFSHIASGYLYHSPSNQKVRVDASFDGHFASSLFDYGNISSSSSGGGPQLVANSMYTLEPSVAAEPQIFRGYVKPSFPLFGGELLRESGAVFGGVVDDRFVGTVASWNILYQGSEPVTVYLTPGNVVVGYDFFDTKSRTGIVTRYFNIEFGKIDSSIFEFPK